LFHHKQLHIVSKNFYAIILFHGVISIGLKLRADPAPHCRL